MNPLNVFVRQPFTQSREMDRGLLQSTMNVVKSMEKDCSLRFLTLLEAQSAESFTQSFERETDRPFTPANFRRYRLELLDQADAFVVLRTGLSESGSFEIAYNIFKGRKSPVFFAIWDKMPIKTTLLRDLDELCPVEYVTFSEAEELALPLRNFFERCRRERWTN